MALLTVGTVQVLTEKKELKVIQIPLLVYLIIISLFSTLLLHTGVVPVNCPSALQVLEGSPAA